MCITFIIRKKTVLIYLVIKVFMDFLAIEIMIYERAGCVLCKTNMHMKSLVGYQQKE